MPEESHKLMEIVNLKKYFPLRGGRFGRGNIQTVKAVDDTLVIDGADHAEILLSAKTDYHVKHFILSDLDRVIQEEEVEEVAVPV